MLQQKFLRTEKYVITVEVQLQFRLDNAQHLEQRKPPRLFSVINVDLEQAGT